MNQDEDLRALRLALKTEPPRPEDILTWKQALRGRHEKRAQGLRRVPLLVQWAVAASIGFVIGVGFIEHRDRLQNEKNSSSSATIETIYTNLDQD